MTQFVGSGDVAGGRITKQRGLAGIVRLVKQRGNMASQRLLRGACKREGGGY